MLVAAIRPWTVSQAWALAYALRQARYLEFIPWIRRPVWAWAPASWPAIVARQAAPPFPKPAAPAPRDAAEATPAPRPWPFRQPAPPSVEILLITAPPEIDMSDGKSIDFWA